MKTTGTRLGTVLALGLAIAGTTLAIQPASAYTPPANTTQFTLEACRHDDGITLPNGSGYFICDDSKYTTGNLKTWAELDLLPHRLTTKTGSAGGTYNVIVAADYENNGDIGYDVLDLLQANGCTATWGAQTITDKVTGGVDQVIYRILEITQSPNTTCVINWVNRIAIGASSYSGASLQSYMFEKDDFSSGKRTLSLPVNQVLPQELAKVMSASQDTAYSWTVSKNASTTSIQFDDTCDAGAPREKPVNIRVEWQRNPGVPGNVAITTTITATNPASRAVDVVVTDRIYAGTTLLDTKACDEVTVPAATSDYPICQHTLTAAPTVTDLNDVASAAYHDAVTGEPITATVEATASTMIAAGDQSNETAVISDSESLSGPAGLKFKVSGTSAGSASGTFVPTLPMAWTQGPVTWTSGSQGGAGFVEFNKLVQVPYASQGSGTLTDTASLLGSDGFSTGYGPVDVSINAYALVKLTIQKTIPPYLEGSDSVTFSFAVTKGGNLVATKELTFTAGETFKTVDVAGLEPGVQYVVTETPAPGWAAYPAGSGQKSVTINLPDCAGTVSFMNDIAPTELAKAEVRKVTDPVGSEGGWSFALQRCASLVSCDDADFSTVATVMTTDAEFVIFEDSLGPLALVEGSYRVIETEQQGWDNLGGAGCEFVVDYPGSAGQTYQCTYTNRARGEIIIRKVTVPAETESPTSFDFDENIVGDGFALVHNGQKTFGDVVADMSYNVVEAADASGEYVLTSIVCEETTTETASTVSLADRKAVVKLDPGETVTCTFTNTKQGHVKLQKYTGGVVRSDLEFFFKLWLGSSLQETLSTYLDADGLLEFASKLVPGTTYTMCESPVPSGYTAYWKLNGSNVTAYNPDSPEDLGVRCYNFTVGAGQTATFVVNNMYPGGAPRTIGYWKNWSTCTSGNQVAVAEKNGGPANGFWLLDDLLPQLIGDLTIDSCAVGVDILDKRYVGSAGDVKDGAKAAKDAAYGLAAQLLAAKLNLAAGAITCNAVQTAVAEGQALLDAINFTGTGSYLEKNSGTRKDALSLAGTLDSYNNGYLCP